MAFRPCIVAAVLAVLAAAGQANDLVDMRRIEERGVALEVPWKSGIARGTGAGDVDGDGFDDVVLSASLTDGSAPGVPVVVFGRPGLRGRVNLDLAFPRTLRILVEGDWHPAVLDPVGDVNGDGYADVWFGDYRYEVPGFSGRGVGFLLFGGPSLPATFFANDLLFGSEAGLAFVSSDPADRYVGVHAATLPDFDGDGRRDLAVVAWRSANSRGEVRAGVVFVISNAASLSGVVDLADVGRTIPGHRIEGATTIASRDGMPAGSLGWYFEGLGDIDGDGRSDLMAVAEDLRPRTAYLVRGRPGLPPLIDLHEWESYENITRFENDSSLVNRWIQGLASLGDMDGDGRDEFLIGLTRGCCPRPDRPPLDGVAYLFYGAAEYPRSVDIQNIDATTLDPALWRAIHPVHPYSYFASSLSPAGDLNGDGLPDFLIGSWYANSGRGTASGEAYALYGRADFPQEVILGDGFEGIRFLGEAADGRLGHTVCEAGDFDGDGNDDVLLTAPNPFGDEDLPARAYIIYGTGSGSPPLTVLSATPPSGGVRGGTQVILSGSGFTPEAIVRFGSLAPLSTRFLSESRLEVLTPPVAELGTVELSVTVAGATRRLPGGFEYTPNLPEYDVENLGHAGFVLEGDESASPQTFSWPAISGIAFGDLDEDGIDDLVAEATRPGGFEVFLVHGAPDLPEVARAWDSSPLVTTITTREPRSLAGATVAFVGDVDGAGGEDLGIGAADGVGYIVFAARERLAPGELSVEDLIEDGQAVRLARAGPVEVMGLVPLGDLTGDGVDDFAVGSRGGRGTPGELLFVRGRREWPPDVDLHDPEHVWSRLHGAHASQALAGRIRQVGDVNGDGVGDLLLDTASHEGVGTAYLLFLGGELPVDASVEDFVTSGGGVRIDLLDGFLVPGESPGFDWFNVAAAGDVNRDGYADMLLGVEGGGGHFEGVTYLVHGGADLPERIEIRENPEEPDGIVRIIGEGSMEQAGRPGPAGDFNADGYADFIIGAPGFQDFGQEAGNVFIVFGGADLPARIDLARLGAHGIKVEGRNVLGGAGFFAGPSGDLDGDGLSDVAFSENALLEGDRGRVYVLYNAFGGGEFIRGDANSDEALDVSDGVFVLTYLFLGGARLKCEDAADSDDGGDVNLSDAVYVLNYLFLGGPPPPPPFPDPGEDGTEDGLDCVGF